MRPRRILFQRLGWAGLGSQEELARTTQTASPRAHGLSRARGDGHGGAGGGCGVRGAAGGELTRGTGGGGVRVEGRRARGSGFGATGAIFLGTMPSAPPRSPTPPLPACLRLRSVSGRLSSIATRNHQKSQRRSLAGRLLHQILPTDSVTNPGYPRRCLLALLPS